MPRGLADRMSQRNEYIKLLARAFRWKTHFILYTQLNCKHFKVTNLILLLDYIIPNIECFVECTIIHVCGLNKSHLFSCSWVLANPFHELLRVDIYAKNKKY